MDIMIDIETMGTRPGSVIASIGACVFDLTKRKLVGDGGFYVNINIADAQKSGLRFEAGTVSWWLDQSDAARAALKVDPQPLAVALMQLSEHFRSHRCVNPWSNGAGFDLVLLESAYFVCGLEAPWKFWNARDTRTLYVLAGVSAKSFFEAGEVAHNALADARAQARAVIAAYDKLLPLLSVVNQVEAAPA